jgi:hypothetical protein
LRAERSNPEGNEESLDCVVASAPRNDGVRFPLSSPTQKPATQGCGRVLGETNYFDENTTTHWTSQASFDFLIHRRWITAHRGMMAGRGPPTPSRQGGRDPNCVTFSSARSATRSCWSRSHDRRWRRFGRKSTPCEAAKICFSESFARSGVICDGAWVHHRKMPDGRIQLGKPMHSR